MYQQQSSSRYARFASNVKRVGDEVSDVMSVNTVLQQCTGKVVRLNIQFQITYSTMVLVVLMERCNFVSAGTETIDSKDATEHFP